MARRARSLAVLLLALLAMAAIGLLVASDSSEAQAASLTVDLDDAVKNVVARSTDTTRDALTFTGTITLERPFVPEPYPQPVSVTPSIEIAPDAADWEYVFHETLEFSSDGTKNFTCTVTVPLALDANDFYTLTFDATPSQVFFYTSTTDSSIVTIAQYYKVRRQYSTAPVRVKQGSMVSFNVTLINRGNGADTVSIMLNNEDELNLLKLTFTYDKSKRIDPGEEVEVTIRVDADPEATETEAQVNFTIRSEGSVNDPNHDTMTTGADFTIVVEPSLVSTVFKYWYLVVPAVVVLVLVGVLLVVRRRRSSELDDIESDYLAAAGRGDEEDEEGEEEEEEEGEEDEDDGGEMDDDLDEEGVLVEDDEDVEDDL